MPIRAFHEADTDAVISLWEESGLVRPWNDPRRDVRRKLGEQPELFLVATDGVTDAPVGTVMAGYDGHRGWIHYLAVAPSHRGGGLGTRLVQAAEDALLARGCPKVTLMVRSSNLAVRDFYERLGFGVDDVVVMGKRLIPDD